MNTHDLHRSRIARSYGGRVSVSDGSAAWEDVRKAVSPWRRWSELSPLQQLDARYDHPGVEWAAYWWRWYDDRWQVGTPVELGVPPRYIG